MNLPSILLWGFAATVILTTHELRAQHADHDHPAHIIYGAILGAFYVPR